MEKLEEAVKQLQNHKAPGLDDLPAEFYKKTIEVIQGDLLDIINCQLDRVKILESDRHGATRLGPKVEGVPRVDQLRPITLLCLDYKILSYSVPNQNILFGGHNILSVIQRSMVEGGQWYPMISTRHMTEWLCLSSI